MGLLYFCQPYSHPFAVLKGTDGDLHADPCIVLGALYTGHKSSSSEEVVKMHERSLHLLSSFGIDKNAPNPKFETVTI
jgi:hypothetical protein